jgi:hypothetical protein
MKEGYYINKLDGRRSYFNAYTLKILGTNFLKEWSPEYKGYSKVDDDGFVPLSMDDVPNEIKEIIMPEPVLEKKTIKELKDTIGEMTVEELKEYQDDDRVTVRKMIEEELKLRQNDLYSE